MRLIPRCYNGNKILDDTIDKISTGLHLSHEAYTHDKKINKVDNAVSNNLSQQNDDTNYQNSDTSRTVKISQMRARGISTNALRTSLPGFSNRYFKINSDGEIQNIPKRSQLEQLTQSLNGNKDVSLSYLDNIFKQGGKI